MKAPTLYMIPETLPYGATVDDDGVWTQVLTRTVSPDPRPTLFLDRDGVIVEEVHYLSQPENMRVVPGAADAIRAANQSGTPVVVVTNQAGIGRGYFTWSDFIAVQEAMLDSLADAGAFINAVFACPHHADGKPPYDVADHPARKPNPGMLLRAAERLPIDLSASWLVGDRAGDIAAARRAGCTGAVHVLSGHGSEKEERETATEYAASNFVVGLADSIADAWPQIPILKSRWNGD